MTFTFAAVGRNSSPDWAIFRSAAGLFALLAGITLHAAPLATNAVSEQWRPLLDEKLSAWEIWIGVPDPSVQGLTPRPGGADEPLGLANDPKHVFSVRTEAGEPVLCISGEIFGGLTTTQTFSNYHFRAQFKWGERKWPPKLDVPRDSGILFHCTGPHGAFWKVWKRCVEFQVEEKNTGDLYCLGGTSATVPVSQGHFDFAGGMEPFGQVANSMGIKVAHLPGDFEKPDGEWNTLELYAVGRSAVYVVNGKIVQALRDIAIDDGSSRPRPLDAGQLQIQSEGAEVYYRRIEICPIADYPQEVKQTTGL